MTHPISPFSINADMGESIGIHSFGNDEALFPLVDTVNVAGGMHAGDPTGISRTIAQAIEVGVTVGSHPGLPDISGFGRREMALTQEEVRDLIRYQTGAVAAFVTAHGGALHHIKPHGALFGMLARNDDLMDAACDVAEDFGVSIFGLAGTAHERVTSKRKISFVPEFYVDLDYDDSASIIVNRKGAAQDIVVVENRVRRALVEGVTETVTGSTVPVRFQSFCVHSDLPNAPTVAAKIREVLREVDS